MLRWIATESALAGHGEQRAFAYSRPCMFHAIREFGSEREVGMTSESVGGILGAIVAAIVLVMAVAYGPIGQFGKSVPVKKVEQPTQAAPVAPAPRGPVIREVPN
jgi:hypothetical protein